MFLLYMNRILQYDNKFRVLITPSYVSSPSMELILGNWNDEHLKGFHVLEFKTLADAMDLAFKYPSIDWNKLVNIHRDAYKIITSSVK
jgi:hypothetical protein